MYKKYGDCCFYWIKILKLNVYLQHKIMSRKCKITNKHVTFGNSVSHANNHTRKRFNVNIHKQRFYVAELASWIKLNVSTSAMRLINKKGIYSVLNK